MPAQLELSTNQLLLTKVRCILSRCLDIFRLLPKRLSRLGNQLILPIQEIHRINELRLGYFVLWNFELVCCLADIIGIPEFYEIIADLVKFNSRPLNQEELELARQYFGDQLAYDRIRIDDCDLLVSRLFKTAYVSFNIINSWEALSNRVFVHELIHVWQFQQVGSLYIARAIAGQLSSEGYDYGGLMNLRKAIRSEKGLRYFNYEQQGDILADHYAISMGLKPRWSIAAEHDIWIYEQILMDLNPDQSKHV